MALKLADALVYLATDSSKLDKELDGAKTKTNSWASNLGSGMKTALTGVVVGAAAGAAAAVAAVGAAAWNVSTETEQAAANIAASLGIPTEAAREFADVARSVYGNNFAGSVTEAGDAVALFAKQLGLAADDPSLQTMTENAFRLRDTFGVEVTDSVDAVKTLMENFGVSGQEAFDLLATGYQRGLDRSGDFLDTIGEYSVQFAEGGTSAVEFFSALDTGLQGGMLGTDKAADAFKEFRLRIQDGSKTTADSLAALGLNADAITEDLANGTLTVKDVFDQVQAAMWATEDPTIRFQAGVGLLGSQFEDLGEKTILAMDITEDWAEGGLTSINSLDAKYATFGDAVEGVWRRLVVSVSPFTDKLLEMVNDAMPSVMAAFDAFDAAVGPAMDSIGSAIDTVVQWVNDLFGDFSTTIDVDGVGTITYLKEWVDKTFPLIQTLIENVLGGIQEFWDTWGEDIKRIVKFIFDSVWTLVDTGIRDIADAITFVLQILTGDWDGAWETLRGIVVRKWEAIKGIVTDAVNGIRDFITRFDWGAIGSAMIDGIKNGISNAWSGLTGWFQGKLNELTDLLPGSEPKNPDSPLRGLSDRGAALIDNFRAGAEQEMVRLQADFRAGLGGMAGALAGPVTNVSNAVYFQGSSYAPGDALSTVQMLNMHYRTA